MRYLVTYQTYPKPYGQWANRTPARPCTTVMSDSITDWLPALIVAEDANEQDVVILNTELIVDERNEPVGHFDLSDAIDTRRKIVEAYRK